MSSTTNITIDVNNRNYNAMVAHEIRNGQTKIVSLVVMDKKAVFPVPFLIDQLEQSILEQLKTSV